MEDSSIKIDKYSLYEILQDNFSLVLIGEVNNNINNIEAKNAIYEFIIDFSPVLIYEAYLYLKNKNLTKENEFYTSIELKEKVKEYRMLTTKKKVMNSDYIKSIIEKMGISFNEDVYDINVVVKNKEIKGFNFAEYNKMKEKSFFEMCYSTNLKFAKVTFKDLTKIFEIDYNNIIDKIIGSINKDMEKLKNSLSGVRYSYKSSKLFRYSTIQNEDKLFILYRFNILNTIIELKKFFKKTKIIINIGNDFVIDIDKFMDKIIALEIDILGRDIRSLNTNFVKKLSNDLDSKFLNIKIGDSQYNFYQLSRKLRNNIHYERIEKLDNDIYSLIENLQEKYLQMIYNEMINNIIFSLDEEDVMINMFFDYCNRNGIEQQEIKENYRDYYTQYFYKRFIIRKCMI